MSDQLLIKLRTELEEVIRRVGARAVASRFVRMENRGRMVATLQPTEEQRLAANDDHARLQKWHQAVESVLRRRGVADQIRSLNEEMHELRALVLMTREDVADITERDWRLASSHKLAAISVRLTRILVGSADSFDIVLERSPLDYESFDVRVTKEVPSRWCVETVDALECMVLPSDPVDLAQIANAEVDWLVEQGRMLFATLFVRTVGKALFRHRAEAASRGRGVRIRLHLRGAGELAEWPWELLHDGTGFLALSRSTSVTRCIDAPQRRRSAQSGKLRVLLTVSSPSALPWLDSDLERNRLAAAIAPLEMLQLLEIHMAPDGSMNTLRRMLRTADDGGRPYHVWHYIGHGELDSETSRSTLAMTREENEVHDVGGWEIAALFAEHSSLRLAFLNACDSGRSPAGAPMTGVATALIEAGVPAVVAMQFPISDEAATLFAEELYGALADGVALDDAVTEARRGLFFHPNVSEWVTPVVFLATDDVAGVFRHSGRTPK